MAENVSPAAAAFHGVSYLKGGMKLPNPHPILHFSQRGWKISPAKRAGVQPSWRLDGPFETGEPTRTRTEAQANSLVTAFALTNSRGCLRWLYTMVSGSMPNA